MVQLVLSEKERMRELRRTRQLRYRKKKEKHTIDLEEETRRLREVIEELEQRRRSVSSTIPAETNTWSVVAEYFRLFRYGMHQSVSTTEFPSASETLTERPIGLLTGINDGRRGV